MFKNRQKYKLNRSSRKTLLRRTVLVACTFSFAAGLYLLLLSYSPQLDITRTIFSDKLPKAEASEFTPDGNTIVIEKLGLIVPFSDAGEHVLENGLWHRVAKNGDPKKGGNFVLAGHRSFIGVTTPQEIIKRSPLYNIHKLNNGDRIRIYFDEKWYDYKVERRFTVKPHEAWVEGQTDKHQLTLYTCTFGGPDEGREVVVAKPI